MILKLTEFKMSSFLFPVFLAAACLVTISSAQSDIKIIGNQVQKAESTSNNRGSVFLLDGAVTQEGLLYAFSAYFLNGNPAVFQIWRPVPGQPGKFKLIAEYIITPSATNSREDIYLHLIGGNCLLLAPGDRLGVYITEAPGPIGYAFEPAEGSSFQYYNLAGTTVNTERTFDTLTYPYKFAASAFISTDATVMASTECPKNIIVPVNLVTTVPPATPQPGPPGPEGEQGAQGSTGPRGATGPRGGEGQQGRGGDTGQQGDTGESGAEGPVGSTGPIGGTGDRGLIGWDGEKGDTGSIGPIGPVGPAGPQGETIKVSAITDGCEWCGPLTSPYLLLAVLVWLGVVSIILVITIAIVAHRKNNPPYNAKKYASSQSDLWKKYEAAGYDNEGYETPHANGKGDHSPDPTYSTVEEGRTTF